jgi:hypothetical protein
MVDFDGRLIKARSFTGPSAATTQVEPVGIDSAAAFGTPSLEIDAVVAPVGVDSSAVFGTPLINAPILANGINSSAVFGTPLVGAIVEPVGIDSSAVFGTPSLSVDVELQPSGINSQAQFGTPNLDTAIAPVGINSSAVFGTPELAETISPVGFQSQAQFGTPSLSIDVELSPAGIDSSALFGTPDVAQVLQPAGINSSALFGTPVVQPPIIPEGIESRSVFGIPSFTGIALSIDPVVGPREGGTLVRIVSGVVDVDACRDAFSDGIIDPSLWTQLVQGSAVMSEAGAAGRIDVDTGITAASSGAIRTLENVDSVDAQMTFTTNDAAVPFDSSRVVFGEVALVVDDTPGSETDLSLRIEANANLVFLVIQARQGGAFSINQEQIIAQFVRGRVRTSVLRVLRAGNRFFVFRNNSKVVEGTWLADTANVQFRIANDQTDASRVVGSMRGYGRRPVITFGGEPMLVATISEGDRFVGQAPAFQVTSSLSVVDVAIAGCDGADAVARNAFSYTLNPNLLQFKQGQKELTVLNDPVLRRRR